jgi:hypothetical protein
MAKCPIGRNVSGVSLQVTLLNTMGYCNLGPLSHGGTGSDVAFSGLIQ